MKSDPDPQWIVSSALRALGYDGVIEMEETDDGHVHVRWNGRHVEAVSVEAAAEYILADARAKAAELHEHSWDGNGCCACGAHELREEDARNYPEAEELTRGDALEALDFADSHGDDE